MSGFSPKVSHVYNVGVNPSSSAVTSDSKYAYVTNSNNFGLPNGDTVTVLNLQDKIPEVTIHDSSFNGPYRVAINDNDSYAYVCNSQAPSQVGEMGTVSVIDIKTNRVSFIISGFDGPSGIVIGKRFIYVLNFGAVGGVGMFNGKTISVIDSTTNTITATIQVDLAPQGMALSHCFNYLFVVCYVDGKQGTGTLSIIDTKNNTVISKINGFFGPFSVVVSKCASYAFVSSFGNNDFQPVGHTVSVVDIQNVHHPKITKQIHKVGIQPSGLALTKDEENIFLSPTTMLYMLIRISKTSHTANLRLVSFESKI